MYSCGYLNWANGKETDHVANANDTLGANFEAIMWTYVVKHAERWRRENPDATLDEFVDECRRQAGARLDDLIRVEVANGASEEQARLRARLIGN